MGKKPSDIKKQPFFSKEFEDKEKGVKYSTLALENFNVLGGERKWDKITVHRNRDAVNTAVIDLCEKIKKKLGKKGETNAACRDSALRYYFSNKDRQTFKTDKFEKTSLDMLNIIGDVIQKTAKPKKLLKLP